MAKQIFSFDDYIEGLPAERRAAAAQVWQTVRTNMPAGYLEQISSKFVMFSADEEMYVSLANQKNYISLHLMPIYVFPELKTKLDASGKKPKGGKNCVNFLRAEDLPLDVIGEIVGAHVAADYKEQARKLRGREHLRGKS